ncbi:MAG TPA: glycosyltransferase [Thermoanaerobaculia bacterium]|nr:glycosyltransferase [Thermoanaerobaculia bacterium]
MKLLQINKHYLPFSGGTIRIVEAIATLSSARCQMTIVTCAPKGRGRTYLSGGTRIVEAGSFGTIWSLPVAPLFPWLCAREIRRHDRVLLHLPLPGPDLVFWAAARASADLVIWWHSDIIRQRGVLRLYEPILRHALGRARTILVSHPAVIRASALLAPFAEKCVVVPFGVDITRFVLTEEERHAAGRLRARLAGKRPLGLFVGRLVYYKGLEVLLEAAVQVDLHLAIAGVGPLESKLRKQAAAAGLSKRVSFLGEVSDAELKLLYEGCDFLVLPSVAASETFGLVQIEAMAAGRPVINTALDTAVPEVSVDGETGLTVPPGNAGALADAMRRLANDTDLRERFARDGRARVRREFSLARMVEALEPILCGGGSAG